jgi:hypothetical protein
VHVTVDLTSEPPGVTLVEPDDCSRFDVRVLGPGDTDDLDRALVGASVGRMGETGALVSVAAVRRLASGSVGDGWEDGFVTMLDYARSRGWLTDDGAAIEAHVEHG